MVRSEFTIAIVVSLLASTHSIAAAQQDRIGADATTTPVGVQTHIGRRVSYVCPAITATQIGSAEVWGSDVYVSDSPICIAAIHAGVLQAGRPGVVTILLAPGADAFTGSARNGVTTKDYGPHATSYTFDRTGALGQIDWSTKGLGIPETFTASIPVVCPSGGAMTFQIWGSDIYQEDSSICTAALHAGLITRANGGNVFVTRDVEQSTFASTDRNGVKSTFWSGGSGSFKVSASSTALIATATNTGPIVASVAATPTEMANCTKVVNLKAVANGSTAVRATWDPMTSTCKTLVQNSGELLEGYVALHWPPGDPTGCPTNYIDVRRFTLSPDSTLTSSRFPACSIATVPPSNTSFDDHYGFDGGPYIYRLWPIYRALCEVNPSTCPQGTVERPHAWSDASVTLPLSNRITRPSPLIAPPAPPEDAWAFQRPQRTVIRLGWTPVNGAVLYRITRVKNTGDPETAIAEKPPIEFAPCVLEGCDVYSEGFDGWALQSGWCGVWDFCRWDDRDVVVGGTYSYRIWALSAPNVLSSSSRVVTVTVVP